MPISIKDIARLAGVSHSTVSRALRGSSLIPAATTERIQKIAKELGYRPSAIARSLVTRRSQTIGVVVTSIADPFNGDVVEGIEEVANQNGFSVILAASHAQPDRELMMVRSFHERRVDGILVASSRVGALYLPVLSELQTPIVLINNQHRSEFAHSISIDNVLGARQATEHLLTLGHKRIAYLGDELGLHSDQERFDGYRVAIQAADLSVDDALIVRGDGKVEGASRAVQKLFSRKARPTSIFCYNDMSALGVLQYAAAARISVPDELSVVGFDDIFVAAYSAPALTTIRQPRREMGRRAMQILTALLAHGQSEKSIVIPGELVVRASTARVHHQAILSGKNSETSSS